MSDSRRGAARNADGKGVSAISLVAFAPGRVFGCLAGGAPLAVMTVRRNGGGPGAGIRTFRPDTGAGL
jgi:hypothetical protein